MLDHPERSPSSRAGDLSSNETTPQPRVTMLVVEGPIVPAAIPEMCEQLRTLLEDCPHVEVVVYDVHGIDHPDVAALDALTRLQLTARRLGRSIQLSRACSRLSDLLTLAGLDDVLPAAEDPPG